MEDLKSNLHTLLMFGDKEKIQSYFKSLIYLYLLDYILKNNTYIMDFIRKYFLKELKNESKDESKNYSTVIIELTYGSKNETLVKSILDFLIENGNSKNITFNKMLNMTVPSDLEFVKIGHKDIECKFSEKERKNSEGKIEIIENLHIRSESLSLKELDTWFEGIMEKYIKNLNNPLKNKICYLNQKIKLFNDINIAFDCFDLITNKTEKNMFGKDFRKIKNIVDFFMNNHKWYKEKGIPYNLGMLLHGPPGTGKTSAIKFLAKYTQRHIINISLKSTTKKSDLFNLFHNETIKIYDYSEKRPTVDNINIGFDKRIYVIEDIDCLDGVVVLDREIEKEKEIEKEIEIEKDEEVDEENNIDLSFLLNLLDGILENENRIIIMTSNCPEKIDKALLRPGRIDLIVKFDKCDHETLNEIFNFMYEVNDSSYIFTEKHSGKITPARVNQIIIKNHTDKDQGYKELLEYIENDYDKTDNERVKRVL
jgi:hypothetical protein